MKKVTLLLFIILVVIFASCSRKAIQKKYYIVEFPFIEDTSRVQAPILPDTYCEVVPIRVGPAFSKINIAFRNRSNEITYFVYHQWANPPEITFTHLLETYLNKKNIFTTVSSELWKVVPDYQIRGEIHQLEVVQNKKRFTAHLHMSLYLIDKKTDRTVVTHTFDRYRPLPKKDLNLFAAVISETFKKELDKFSQKIIQYLQKQKLTDNK